MKDSSTVDGVADAKDINTSNQVLIRSYAAGVHFGELKSKEYTPSGCVVKLNNARRIWSWEGACSLSQVAVDGVSGGRISVSVPEIEIVNAIEIIPISEKSLKVLTGIPVWKK